VSFPSIGIIGAGATGGYLAARLAAANLEVTLLARGSTLAAVQAGGIRVEELDGATISARPNHTVAHGDPVDPVDIVIVCVKSYDTDEAARLAAPLLSDSGYILCTQNGIDNETILEKRFGQGRVVPGVLYIGVERTEPNVIRCSVPPRLVVGAMAGESRHVGDELHALFSHAGIDCTIDEEILASKWQKFLFNCALNPLTSLTRLRLGQILERPAGRNLFEQVLDEALAVAKAHGAPIRMDAREQVMATAERMNISSSMAEDLKAGRPIELDAFSGLVGKLGAQTGVPTPATQVLYQLLAVLDPGTSASRWR